MQLFLLFTVASSPENKKSKDDTVLVSHRPDLHRSKSNSPTESNSGSTSPINGQLSSKFLFYRRFIITKKIINLPSSRLRTSIIRYIIHNQAQLNYNLDMKTIELKQKMKLKMKIFEFLLTLNVELNARNHLILLKYLRGQNFNLKLFLCASGKFHLNTREEEKKNLKQNIR